MKVEDLNPAEYNPRKITEAEKKSLAESMAEFGDLSGVVFNIKTKRLIGGHQRTDLLDPEWKIIKRPTKDTVGTTAIGYIQTPTGRWAYREVNWTEKKEKLANIAANNQGGKNDMPKLKEMIFDLDDGKIDLSLTGLTEDTLAGITNYGKQTEIVKDIANDTEHHAREDINALANEIIKKITESITAILNTDPDQLKRAHAIIIPSKGSKELFILTDPATRDAIIELRRYHADNAQSPLESFFKSIFPLKNENNTGNNKKND